MLQLESKCQWKVLKMANSNHQWSLNKIKSGSLKSWKGILAVCDLKSTIQFNHRGKFISCFTNYSSLATQQVHLPVWPERLYLLLYNNVTVTWILTNYLVCDVTASHVWHSDMSHQFTSQSAIAFHKRVWTFLFYLSTDTGIMV